MCLCVWDWGSREQLAVTMKGAWKKVSGNLLLEAGKQDRRGASAREAPSEPAPSPLLSKLRQTVALTQSAHGLAA